MNSRNADVHEENLDKSGMQNRPSVSVRDATISLAKANVIGFLLLPVTALFMIVPFWILWGKEALGSGFMSMKNWYISLPVFFLVIVMHELLHAVGYIQFGKATRNDIQFGMNWKALTPYAHCKAIMSARAYRIAVLLPGLLLGILPFFIAMIFGSGTLVVWGFLLTAAAGGDASILWAIRDVLGTEHIRDHPSRAGCEILSVTRGAD